MIIDQQSQKPLQFQTNVEGILNFHLMNGLLVIQTRPIKPCCKQQQRGTQIITLSTKCGH